MSPPALLLKWHGYYAGANDEAAVYQAYVWNARLNMLSCDLTTASDGNVKWFFGAVEHLLGYEQFTMAELLDWGADNGVPTAGLKAVQGSCFCYAGRRSGSSGSCADQQ